MTNLSERIAALSPEQRELLLRRWAAREQQENVSQQERREVTDQASLPRAFEQSGVVGAERRSGDSPIPILSGHSSSPDSRTYFPLSFAQERLWFLHQWDQGSAWYNVHMAYRLPGPLQVAVLERSLAAVVQRHKVLQTRFEDHLGHPVQIIGTLLTRVRESKEEREEEKTHE